jgi:hypothetical protein
VPIVSALRVHGFVEVVVRDEERGVAVSGRAPGGR